MGKCIESMIGLEEYLGMKEDIVFTKRYICVTTKQGKMKLINLSDIIFFEKINNAEVYILGTNFKITIKSSLKGIMEKIRQNSNFFYSHKSFIVNMSYIEEFRKVHGSYEVIFKNCAERASLSRNGKAQLSNYFIVL